MVIYKIKLYLPPYEFKIGLYVNFRKWWNVKFQAKYHNLLLSRFQFLQWKIQTAPYIYIYTPF
jgi:hypothetical protein